MFSRKHTYTHTGSGIPLFFKLWFVFVATLAIGIFALVGFSIYSIVSDPAVIGRFVGEIEQGYITTVNPKTPVISQ